MDWLASSLEAISTKANPRDLPVNLSATMESEVTVPDWAKRSRMATSVVWNERLPTYRLLFM